MIFKSILIFLLLLNFSFAKQSNYQEIKDKPNPTIKMTLLKKFMINYKDKERVRSLKKYILSLKGKAVPALIEVMKSSRYSDKNRWIATFMLGRIMGRKSSPFIAKFIDHPNWVLRMASLKALLALKEMSFESKYVQALNDKSLLVRIQAIENIRGLHLVKHAPSIWKMLYDKRNYYKEDKSKEGTHIIKNIITAIGDLKFKKAKKPLLSMSQKKKYKDVFNEIDYSLKKITGKKSPQGDVGSKMRYWKRVNISELTI